MEFNTAQDRLYALSLLKKSHRFVGVAFEGEVLELCKGQKGEHVAARKRGHEGLLGIGKFRGAKILRSGRGPQRHPLSEVEFVIARVVLVAEGLSFAVPGEVDGV